MKHGFLVSVGVMVFISEGMLSACVGEVGFLEFVLFKVIDCVFYGSGGTDVDVDA